MGLFSIKWTSRGARTIPDRNDSRDGWAAGRLVRACKARFEKGWRELPDGVVRRWVMVVVGGFAVSAALTAAMTLGVKAWTAGTSFGWEPAVMRWFGDLLPLSMARWISVLGNSLWLWPVMIFAAGMSAWHKRPLTALSLFPGYAFTQVIVAIGWLLWDRTAPQIITEQGESAVFNSFPSGHTAHAVFAVGILCYLWWRRASHRTEKLVVLLVFLIVAGAVSCGRLASGAHWPTDIASAWAVGLMWVAVQIVAQRMAGVDR